MLISVGEAGLSRPITWRTMMVMMMTMMILYFTHYHFLFNHRKGRQLEEYCKESNNISPAFYITLLLAPSVPSAINVCVSH